MNLPKYKYYLAFIDIFILLISFFEVHYLALRLSGHVLTPIYYFSRGEISLLLIVHNIIFTFIFVVIFQSNNLYKINVFLTRSAQLAVIIKSIFYGVIILIASSFVFKIAYIIDSRIVVFLTAIIVVLNISIMRILLLRYLYVKFAKHLPTRRKTAIIGAGKSGKLLAAKLNFEEIYGLEFCGFIDDNYPAGEIIFAGKKNLGCIEDLKQIKRINRLEELIISIDNISYENLLNIVDKCNEAGIKVNLNSQLFNIVAEKFVTEEYFNVPVINASPRVNMKWYLLLKRVVDFLLSLMGLILLSPILFIIAVAIKISSRGPVFYKQVRIGKNGREFRFYKFRSMRIVNEVDTERIYSMIEFMKNSKSNGNGDTKVINESRLTRVGKFIRKTSLDELPQLLNVIKGNMSLVGPRPSLTYEWANYDNWQKRRVEVLPGCTGVWQVSGRSNVSFNDSVVLDLYYISNMSPWFDLQLMLKTIPVMIFGKGGK